MRTTEAPCESACSNYNQLRRSLRKDWKETEETAEEETLKHSVTSPSSTAQSETVVLNFHVTSSFFIFNSNVHSEQQKQINEPQHSEGLRRSKKS